MRRQRTACILLFVLVTTTLAACGSYERSRLTIVDSDRDPIPNVRFELQPVRFVWPYPKNVDGVTDERGEWEGRWPNHFGVGFTARRWGYERERVPLGRTKEKPEYYEVSERSQLQDRFSGTIDEDGVRSYTYVLEARRGPDVLMVIPSDFEGYLLVLKDGPPSEPPVDGELWIEIVDVSPSGLVRLPYYRKHAKPAEGENPRRYSARYWLVDPELAELGPFGGNGGPDALHTRLIFRPTNECKSVAPGYAELWYINSYHRSNEPSPRDVIYAPIEESYPHRTRVNCDALQGIMRAIRDGDAPITAEQAARMFPHP